MSIFSHKNNHSQLDKKQKKFSSLFFWCSTFFSCALVAGSATTMWYVYNNHQNSNEFSKSVNGKIRCNPTVFEEKENKGDEQIARKNLEQTAQRLSNWLKYNGCQSNDVAYELGDFNDSTRSWDCAYLTANFDITQIESCRIADNKCKIDNDPYLTFFNNISFNSNNRTLVYRWWNEKDLDTGPEYSVLDFSDIFKLPRDKIDKDDETKVLSNKSGEKGLMLKIDESHNELNEIYSDFSHAYKKYNDSPDDPSVKNKNMPRLYIINNMEGMFNEIQYHTMFAQYANKSGSEQEHTSIKYNQWYNNSNYSNFVKNSLDLYWDGTAGRESKESNWWAYKDIGIPQTQKETVKNYDIKLHEGDIKNSEILHYLDVTTIGNIEASFMNKYIEKLYVVKEHGYQEIFPDEITDTYTNDGASEKEDPQLKYAWISLSSENDANNYLNQMVIYNWKCKIDDIFSYVNNDIKKSFESFINDYVDYKFVAPKYTNTIWNNNNCLQIILIGFVMFLLLLLFVLVFLYRVVGLMSWLSIIVCLAVTFLLSSMASSFTLSLSLLFGMFIVSVVGFICSVAFGERIRKWLNSDSDVSTIIAKGIKSSFWPIVDISMICLIFGICFLYIAPINLNALGLSLVIGAFCIFACLFLINSLLLILFFSWEYALNNFVFIGKPSNKFNELFNSAFTNLPSSISKSQLSLSFYNRFITKKTNFINKTAFINCIVLSIFLVGAIVALIIFGFMSNNLFLASQCLFINSNSNDVLDVIKKQGIIVTSYSNLDNWWVVYINNCTTDQLNNIKEILGITTTIELSSLFGNTNKDIFQYAMLSILIGGSITIVYEAFRLNWFAIIPTIVGNIFILLLIFGICAAIQLKFDQQIVLGFAFIAVTNAVLTSHILCSFKEAWKKTSKFSNIEYKFIINMMFKNMLRISLLITICHILFIAFFGLCQPVNTFDLLIAISIGLLINSFICPYIISYIVYLSLKLHNKILKYFEVKRLSKKQINYDLIDEQLIVGINKFNKKNE